VPPHPEASEDIRDLDPNDERNPSAVRFVPSSPCWFALRRTLPIPLRVMPTKISAQTIIRCHTSPFFLSVSRLCEQEMAGKK
jgi:hypothetical protein